METRLPPGERTPRPRRNALLLGRTRHGAGGHTGKTSFMSLFSQHPDGPEPRPARPRRRPLLSRRDRNVLHSVLLVGGMAGLLAVCAWIIAGPAAVVWTLVLAAVSMVASPRVSHRFVLRLFGAASLPAATLPDVHRVAAALADRAGLGHRPKLMYIASPTMNAFTVGTREDAAITMTTGLLRRLTLRELAGVLAHEVSHVSHNDMWVMGLADTISRLTRAMSLLGVLLVAVNLPLMLAGGAAISWLLLALMILAPTVGTLLQLALSRVREYDADLEAAGLTGDPAGLAAALQKLEAQHGRFWEDIFLPGRRAPEPSVLRSHPHTSERVKRLLALAPPPSGAWLDVPADHMPGHSMIPPSPERPRWRRWGVWY